MTLFLFGILVLTLAATACSSDGKDKNEGSNASSIAVELDNYYFKPNPLTLIAGKSVELELGNEGSVTHTFTVQGLNIDEEVPSPQTKKITVTPDKAGEYTIICRFHEAQGMKATLTVK